MGKKYALILLVLLALAFTSDSQACMLHEIWQSRGGQIKLTLDIPSMQAAQVDVQLAGYAIQRQTLRHDGQLVHDLLGRDLQPLLIKPNANGQTQVISGQVALDLAVKIKVGSDIINLSGLRLSIHNGDRALVHLTDQQGAVWFTTSSLALHTANTDQAIRFQPMTVYPGGMLLHRYRDVLAADVVIGELEMVFPAPTNLQTLTSAVAADQRREPGRFEL